ncbi:hypothetical protein BDF21DRAFT_449436 [Thamnidium elegans]|nr:hypothetical protein BDF21DRAFT_449436 [Thamnidium elegans]
MPVNFRKEYKGNCRVIVLALCKIRFIGYEQMLCLDKWENLIEYIHLIRLCDTHYEDDDSVNMQLFVPKNKIGFTSNLKTFIPDNVLYFKIIEKSGSYKLRISYHECEPSEDNETIALKYDIAENIKTLTLTFEVENFCADVYLPLIISIMPHSYFCSLHFDLKDIDNDLKRDITLKVGDPLSLF